MKKSTDFDENIFRIYVANVSEIKLNTEEVIYTTQASKLFRSYVMNYPQEYLKRVIRDYMKPSDNTSYTLDKTIFQVFGTLKEFLNFVESQPNTLDVLRVLDFVRNYNDTEPHSPVNYNLNVLEIISNNKVLFTKGPEYIQSSAGPSTEFYHNSFGPEDAFRNVKNPQLRYAKWIAHANPVTKEEAIKGGDYEFLFEFDNNWHAKKLVSATFYFLVDDYLSLFVNGEKVIDKIASSEQKLVKREILSFIKPGKNSFHFIINNITFGKPETLAIHNPYGFIFSLKMSFDAQIN
jgi:hypothetical protein